MSTTESIGSNCLSLNSLPEPTKLTAEFLYSRYSAQETSQASAGSQVKLTFFAPETFSSASGSIESISVSPTLIEKEKIAKIHTAADITVGRSSLVSIRDTGVLKRSFETFERSCKLRSITGNPTDRSLKLSSNLTNESVNFDKDILQEVAANYAAQSVSFFSSGRVVDSQKFVDADGSPVSVLLSDKIIYEALGVSEKLGNLKNSVALGILANETTLSRQEKERSNGIKISGFEADSVFVPSKILDTRFSYGEVTRVAIQIERVEFLTDGSTQSKTFTLLASSNSYVDNQVKYGSRYTYSAKAIYSLQIKNAISVDRDPAVKNVEILISSAPSNLATVITTEKVPPPYPVDVSFRFDYQRSEFSIRWEFPVNRVQDITRFQVFRRSSIKEPFLLLKELDFDKSEFKISRPDEPLPVNVSKSDFPVRSYVDRDFGRSSTYIYAVAAVDAHGYVSNYSAQYEVSFDMRTRGLRVKCVSPAGAPRPYPNMYFNSSASLVEDTITRSKVSSVNFVFDPEYLRVNDRNGNDLNLIRFAGAKYYLSVIDTTRAEQISVPVEIIDSRTT